MSDPEDGSNTMRYSLMSVVAAALLVIVLVVGFMPRSAKAATDGDISVPDTDTPAPTGSQLLSVQYPARAVQWGATFSKSDTSAQPTIQFQAEQGKTYGLIMYDPDAPSRAKAGGKTWLHWLVVNMDGSSDVTSGKTVVDYNGPSPPSGSGNHRYVLMAFEMTSAIKNPPSKSRARFDLSELKTAFNFKSTVAQNFFIVKG